MKHCIALKLVAPKHFGSLQLLLSHWRVLGLTVMAELSIKILARQNLEEMLFQYKITISTTTIKL